IIHYHWLAHANGFLKTNSLLQCSRRIEAFNSRLRAEANAAPFSALVRPAQRATSKIVVASGWWCDETPRTWTLGDMATRSIAFFDLWYRQVMRCFAPHRIIVTDSAS